MLITRNRGFALIEVMIAATIIAIGLSGVGALMLSTLQATQDSSQVSQAMWISNDLAGRIQSNRRGALDNDYAISGSMDCNVIPGNMCATHVANGLTVEPNPCSPAQMAAFDIWNALCGTDTDSLDAAGEFLRNPSIQSTCSGIRSDGKCDQYTTVLTWSSANQNSTVNTYINIVQVEPR